MDRRGFLLSAMAGAVIGQDALLADTACPSTGQSLDQRALAWLMLAGGPDFRFLFPPAFDPDVNSVGYGYWSHQGRAHGINAGSSAAWASRWLNDYHHRATADGVPFGILKSAGWLAAQWDAGNVALVCNAVGSTSRDHPKSIRIMDQGILDPGLVSNRSGWGGRLATLAGGNCISLTTVPREFCFGFDGADVATIDKTNLVALRDSRNAGLFSPDPTLDPRFDGSGRIARSLSGWYRARQQAETFGPDSRFFRIVESERKLREIGDRVDGVLADCPVPPEIAALYAVDALPGQTQPLLRNTSFGIQVRNLYDAILANRDLAMRVVSLDYGGWDSHQGQRPQMEPRLGDIFGVDGALDMLWRNLAPGDRANLVLVISGEFGRQIKDNGGGGTDHGRGNTILVIGDGVRGGVYGDMFPEAELGRLGDPSPDILGLTELDHVFGAACDWVQPGSGDGVFPSRSLRAIERVGLVDDLFV